MKQYINHLLFVPFGLVTLLLNLHVRPGFTVSVVEMPGKVSITLSAVGDMMCHSEEFMYARVEKDSFDFTPYFEYVKPEFARADIVVGNLETVLAGAKQKYTGYPFFNSPDDYAFSLKQVGFNLLSLANNHSLDRGAYGVLRTIQVVADAGINSMGTANSANGRDSLRIYTHKGIKTGFICYSYGTNGNPVPKGKEYLINVIDTSAILADIQRYRPACELLVVFLHFGVEYEKVPNEGQKQIAQLCAKNGVDVLIGSHPHVLQPIEVLQATGNATGQMLCAYSLGNFISNQQWRYSDAGAVLHCGFEKDTVAGTWVMLPTTVTPTWVFKGYINGKKTYRILPPSSDSTAYSFLRGNDKAVMNQAFNDTREKMKELHQQIVVK